MFGSDGYSENQTFCQKKKWLFISFLLGIAQWQTLLRLWKILKVQMGVSENCVYPNGNVMWILEWCSPKVLDIFSNYVSFKKRSLLMFCSWGSPEGFRVTFRCQRLRLTATKLCPNAQKDPAAQICPVSTGAREVELIVEAQALHMVLHLCFMVASMHILAIS